MHPGFLPSRLLRDVVSSSTHSVGDGSESESEKAFEQAPLLEYVGKYAGKYAGEYACAHASEYACAHASARKLIGRGRVRVEVPPPSSSLQ